MTPKETNQLQNRIDELEMKLAFQEHTIEELNHEITAHQMMLDKMLTQMKFLVDKVKSTSGSNMADESEETPPPHY
ncbi:SlyX family protein [Thaumasiovibrio sp. DFM-14]|uniref:SlyX family protein n=1 Tax=Thaumasiovibrio sp. DFM-14 TaxID=3384792 RepID=UPI0039A2C612